MSHEEAEKSPAMSDSAPEQARHSMFLNGLVQRGPPATSLRSTTGSGIGTPIDDTTERPPFPRADTTTTEPSSRDQDDESNIVIAMRRPSNPRPETDGSNDNNSSGGRSSYFEVLPQGSTAGFPVLVDYSAVLEPAPVAECSPSSLVIEYGESLSLSDFKNRLQADIRSTARVNVQNIVGQRVAHMHLGVIWGQGKGQCLSVPWDDRTFKLSMELIRLRGLSDKVVVLFEPRNVPTPVKLKVVDRNVQKSIDQETSSGAELKTAMAEIAAEKASGGKVAMSKK